MVWEIAREYPWSFFSTVVLPGVVALGAIVVALINGMAGLETLKGNFSSSQRAVRIEQGVDKLISNDSTLQTTLRLLESYNDKISAAGKRDVLLASIINQYQRLSRSAALFAQMARRDNSSEQGKIATEILGILNQDVVRTVVRNDLPGKPLIIEVEPNSFRVIYPVPMHAAPNLTFDNLPVGVTPEVSDKSEISFSVTFLPTSIPVKAFSVTASAEF